MAPGTIFAFVFSCKDVEGELIRRQLCETTNWALPAWAACS